VIHYTYRLVGAAQAFERRRIPQGLEVGPYLTALWRRRHVDLNCDTSCWPWRLNLRRRFDSVDEGRDLFDHPIELFSLACCRQLFEPGGRLSKT